MKIQFWPGNDEYEEGENIPKGPAGKEIRKLLSKNQRLHMRVISFLKNLQKTDDLKHYINTGEIKKLNSKNNLMEMRIPPQGHGGVFRIYFGVYSDNTIIIVNAELKHKKEAMKVDTASSQWDEVSKQQNKDYHNAKR